MFVLEKGIQKLQVMEDSKVVIDWMKGITTLGNFHLSPIYDDIINIKKVINKVTFMHVFKEKETILMTPYQN